MASNAVMMRGMQAQVGNVPDRRTEFKTRDYRVERERAEEAF